MIRLRVLKDLPGLKVDRWEDEEHTTAAYPLAAGSVVYVDEDESEPDHDDDGKVSCFILAEPRSASILLPRDAWEYAEAFDPPPDRRPDPAAILTQKESAAALGVDARTIRRWTALGLIRQHVTGGYAREEVLRFAAQQAEDRRASRGRGQGGRPLPKKG